MALLRRIYYAFPVCLLTLHFRNHLVLIGVWILLALFMTGAVGRFFGLFYLLILPEYRGQVNFWSFYIMGISFGAFFMTWNLTTYLLSANRFPFLATLQAPFTKFSLNNALIPLAFLMTYLWATIWFQAHDELTAPVNILYNVTGFLSGTATFVLAVAAYLHFTNKDIAAFLKPGALVPQPGSRLLAPGKRLPTLRDIRRGLTRRRVDTYLNERLHVRPVRSVEHYNPEMLGRVFRQNHLNAVIVQMAAFLTLIGLGLFMDNEFARIPTGATIMIIGSMTIAMFGAIVFWFHNWSLLIFILLLLFINTTTGMGVLNYRNRAYGLDYAAQKRAVYSYKRLQEITSEENKERDKAATQAILEKWLARNKAAGTERPKMVFLCVSGGGMRSALWTMKVLQQADQATEGRLLRQSVLISGASGGILGAAYFRETYRQQQDGVKGVSAHDPALIDDIGKDLLNPVSFAIVANDLFFPLSSFQSGNFRYRKDRGYLFERQLDENCRNMLGRRLSDYRRPEAEAQIPMMIVTPTILNDARRLLISPQGVSYLMQAPDDNRHTLQPEIDGVDFRKLFAGNQADSLAFTTALRMNCTYPLVLPNVWLPTSPAIEALDAGFRDNYGIMTAVRFSHVFRDWILQNTGGVVIVQIRCWEKVEPIGPSDTKGIVDNLFTAVDVASQLTTMQDFDQDNTLALLDDMLGKNKLELISFIYQPIKKENEASMSLHLSKAEKLDIIQAYERKEVQECESALRKALGN